MTKATTLNIRTPEGILFAQTLASPAARFFAWLIDLGCIFVVMIALTVGMLILSFLSPDVGSALRLLLYFLLSIGYGIAFEWLWKGQTIGKRAMHLRVVDAEGMRLTFSQVAIRNLLRAIDALPVFYLVGGVAALLSGKAQRLGDLAANTVVIRLPRFSHPDLEKLLPDKFNSLRSHPHLAARLRQRVTPGEAAVALQAIMRRDEFDPAARVELFGDLAGHFRSKVSFPAEATEGIADEQYVRDVVDILYRSERRPAGAGNRGIAN